MIWVVAGMALCLVVIVAARTTGQALDVSGWPVSARPPLSRPEQTLYWRLCEAFPDHIVLAQVAIAQLLEVNDVPNRRAVFNRYRRLVADFVVCTRAFEVVAVIELDDRTHQNPGRASADERKSAVLGAAGLLLMRFNVRALPTAGELRSQLATAVPASSQPPQAAERQPQRHPAAA
jgi:very-short-patch-repair endonuclease